MSEKERGYSVVSTWNEEDVAWVNRWCRAMAESLAGLRVFRQFSVEEILEFLKKETRRYAGINTLNYSRDYFDTTAGAENTLRRAIDHTGFSCDITAAAVDRFVGKVHAYLFLLFPRLLWRRGP